MACIYGYICVREDQEAIKQEEALKELSVPEENIFIDNITKSGKERPKLQKMERKLHKEDLVYIKKLSSLGCGYDEILEQWRFLTKKLKADVVVLDSPLLDTRRGKEIMGSLVSDIVLETLEFVSENEHEKHISKREKICHTAKSRGVRLGRPLTSLPENFDSVYQQWKAGKITGVIAAEECGMPISSFRYRAKIYGNEQDNKQTQEIAKESIA